VTDKELSQRAKEYFAQIRKTDRLIQRLTDTVNTLRFSLTSQNYELKPDKVQTSGPKDTLGETIAKIMSLEDDINTRIDELVERKADAMRRIQNVPDQDQQNILIARYVNGEKWEKIAVDLNFSIAQIYRIHGAALLDFIKENPDILKDDSKR
jgi:DNA-directed RNA polymerase specialized sigma subunit